MNVSLTSEQEELVSSKVDSGHSTNASEVVRSALQLMKEQETEREQQLAWMRREVEKGWNEAKAGKLTPASGVKSEIADFKARWKSEFDAATS